MSIPRSRDFANAIQVIFLLFILFWSMAPMVLRSRSTKAVSSIGSIHYWRWVNVTVDVDVTVGVNSLSLGFMLDHEWKAWRDSFACRELASDASFRLVRFFDWKASSPKPCTYWNESSNTGIFNWTDIDLLVQRILEIGAEPLITLGSYVDGQSCIPFGMSVNPDTDLPHPQSFASYAAQWVKHFKTVGLRVRFYEIWNEPLSYFYKDWIFNQTKLSYFFELFNATYTKMHEADLEILVGNDASLYRVFLDYWVQRRGKLDFLSFHKYDSKGFHESDAMTLQRAEQRYFVSDKTWYGVNDARKKWLEIHGTILPAINSESNLCAEWENGTAPQIQQMVGAVWTALMLRSCVLNHVDFSIYYSFQSSLSWQPNNTLTGGAGFGMINSDNNQPWYPYYVHYILGNNLGVRDCLVETGSSSEDIRSMAWFQNETLNVLLINKVDQPLRINLQGLEGELSISKIDNAVSWEAPSVQILKIDSTEPLLMIGYTVALIKISTMP